MLACDDRCWGWDLAHKTQITGAFLPLAVAWPFMALDVFFVFTADDMVVVQKNR